MAKYTQNYAKMAVLASIQVFFLSKCEQLRRKTQVYRLLDPCIMSCESRAVHMSRLLRFISNVDVQQARSL